MAHLRNQHHVMLLRQTEHQKGLGPHHFMHRSCSEHWPLLWPQRQLHCSLSHLLPLQPRSARMHLLPAAGLDWASGSTCVSGLVCLNLLLSEGLQSSAPEALSVESESQQERQAISSHQGTSFHVPSCHHFAHSSNSCVGFRR